MPTPERVAVPQGKPHWRSRNSSALGPLREASLPSMLAPSCLMGDHYTIKHAVALPRSSCRAATDTKVQNMSRA